ncbi:unnamed protein product [Schistocephalus solidus]|uniref:Uncharacterized protein n=1 Tax=Schistocephalus solidus TaxID=70667 RepID=A0A183T957_SCHSO|nr:unnamed protein product [Schistocephalus solidus]
MSTKLISSQLLSFQTLPTAFSVRTNIEFDGLLHGLDAPIPSRVVSFKPREFLHIRKRFSLNWWIGRVVRIGAPLGFIPSVAKLEGLRSSLQSNLSQLLLSEALASPNGNSSVTPKSPLTPSTLTANSANSSSNHGNESVFRTPQRVPIICDITLGISASLMGHNGCSRWEEATCLRLGKCVHFPRLYCPPIDHSSVDECSPFQDFFARRLIAHLSIKAHRSLPELSRPAMP